ncbi:hypothetical protein CAI21_03130 [Alkalilimnicola ehrlichii]|uniref:Uncharacterized protein n=1 Tax=Alkalilimnicola ehrlichii TaxID=351052 RepID=A0A3E0X0H5_9GAMM|nr:hypothetical protein CAI21_03130 [Alkalilimnicola ehrlichii]RFA38934.1 hypothetical protein CAL65_03275 [Alkalilimnicola ehrlichii]
MNAQRNRAWRRFKSKMKIKRGSRSQRSQEKPEKSWKLMYIRSEKLIRAKQLGMDYPAKTVRQVLDDEQPLGDK